MFDFGDRPETSRPQMNGNDTPPDLEVSSAIRFVQSDVQLLSDGEDMVGQPLNNSTSKSAHNKDFFQSLDLPLDKPGPSGTKNPAKPKVKPSSKSNDSDDLSSETSDTDGELGASKIFTDDYNPKDFENLDVPPEIKNLFEYIVRYTPQKLDIEYKLHPFIPEYIPAVGDIDAFLKVLPPDHLPDMESVHEIENHLSTLGLKVLDEPCGNQTDPALLHMKLRSVSTVTGALIAGPPPAIAKSAKDIDRWIMEMQNIHANRSQQQAILESGNTIPMVGDIDQLMAEWPPEMEQALDVIGFPSPHLDCSLPMYIEIICTLLDIPIGRDRKQVDYINALNTLFNLYSAIRNT